MQAVQDPTTRHEIVVCITGETPDSRGMVVTHEASKAAIEAWNDHMRGYAIVDFDPICIVGRITNLYADDEQRKVFAQIRLWKRLGIWLRIQQKEITGAGIGLSAVQMERRDGLMIVTQYELVHISLLGDPSCLDCRGITILH